MPHNPSVNRTRGPVSDEVKALRKAERRSQLIAAAIAIYGEYGYRHASVRQVCEAAGLTQRYFYESFSHSDELLIACYERVTDELQQDILVAVDAAGDAPRTRARAALAAYLTALKREPQAANVFLVDIRGISPAVDRQIDDALSVTGRHMVRAVLRREPDIDDLLLAGVMGGIIHIALRWVTANYEPTIDQVVDAALRLTTPLLQEE
ncbi:TetR/AcrR family transcriptional regulator [Pseudomonas sp.]|uniref:TetR/AcrR family transcriptional regulator n=1 Tax=Pseudomonas sp. TaxID=306 RepID=UPI00272A0CDD|nr:TetR/AcrR family transcriptional regulator [Pseudomonas sp.]